MTRTSKLYTTSVIVLSLSSLIQNIAFMLSASYFPYYTISLGAPAAYVGFFAAAFLATTALLSSRLGSLSDRIGRKKLIQAGLVADVFLGTMTGLIQHWGFLLVIRAFNGIATAAVSPAAEASLIDQVPRERKGEALGFFLTISMIGWFIGPAFGGAIQFLAENGLGLRLEDSYRVPYFVDSLLSIIALALVAWKVEETRGSRVQPVKVVQDDVKLGGSLLRALRVLYVASITNGFAIGFIIQVGVFFFNDMFQAAPLQIGLILSVSGLVGIGCNYIAGRMADRIGRKPLITLGGLSSRLSSIALPFTSNIFQATGLMVFRSLGINVAMPATRALRADLVPAKVRGKLFGRLQAFFYGGMIFGTILGPWIYYIYGIGLPFFISGALGLAALALLIIFVKEPPRQT